CWRFAIASARETPARGDWMSSDGRGRTAPVQGLRTSRGRSLPLGATALAEGVNFALFCRHGTAVWLVLYPLEGGQPLAEIALDRGKNRTGSHWHMLVAGLPPAFRYGWRVDGPKGDGHRFDPSIVLLDPAATALSGGVVWGQSKEPEPDRSVRRSLFI